jgi:hypothetical protein
MAVEQKLALEKLGDVLEPPVLIISTVVGHGMYTLGEAVRERFADQAAVEHVAVEDHLPGSAVGEDLRRYKWMSNHLPFLIYLVHSVPLFYYRKYFREAWLNWSNLEPLKAKIQAAKPRTVLCISHRPAFWVSNLKRREKMDFQLWGLLGEYGPTLGWKYLFWPQLNGFLSPLDRCQLPYAFPEPLKFQQVDLPARKAFYPLAARPGSKDCVLVVCGFWGQGPLLNLLKQLLTVDDQLRIHVVCGENVAAYERIQHAFPHSCNICVHGAVQSLIPLMEEAGCVITKPGISTIQEVHAAGRKLFLVKGIPVSENRHNAGFALRHYEAEWFTIESFRRWRAAPEVVNACCPGQSV